jgi:hypothetical protein
MPGRLWPGRSRSAGRARAVAASPCPPSVGAKAGSRGWLVEVAAEEGCGVLVFMARNLGVTAEEGCGVLVFMARNLGVTAGIGAKGLDGCAERVKSARAAGRGTSSSSQCMRKLTGTRTWRAAAARWSPATSPGIAARIRSSVTRSGRPTAAPSDRPQNPTAASCAMSCRLSIVEDHVGPELRSLLDNAVTAGAVREGVDALDLLIAVSNLCAPHSGTDNISRPPDGRASPRRSAVRRAPGARGPELIDRSTSCPLGRLSRACCDRRATPVTVTTSVTTTSNAIHLSATTTSTSLAATSSARPTSSTGTCDPDETRPRPRRDQGPECLAHDPAPLLLTPVTRDGTVETAQSGTTPRFTLTSKAPARVSAGQGPGPSVSTQRAPGGIRTPNLLIRRDARCATERVLTRPLSRANSLPLQVRGLRTLRVGSKPLSSNRYKGTPNRNF